MKRINAYKYLRVSDIKLDTVNLVHVHNSATPVGIRTKSMLQKLQEPFTNVKY
jgi:spore maturation protein SpmA